jgi:hypothetical protein
LRVSKPTVTYSRYKKKNIGSSGFIFSNTHALIEALNVVQRMFLRSFPMRLKVELSKSQKIFLVAILLSVGVGGVTAATTIGINNDIPLNLGTGYTSTSTCDNDVLIGKFTSGTSAQNFRYNGFTLSNIDASANACANQVMRLVVVDRFGTAQQASWLLPSSATNYTYIFGTISTGRIAGTNYYASIAYASIDISDLSKFSLSIGNI